MPRRQSDPTKESGKVWRSLLNGEYPPPGPTKLGDEVTMHGRRVRPILVYAKPLDRPE